jgi:hypothetical protein
LLALQRVTKAQPAWEAKTVRPKKDPTGLLWIAIFSVLGWAFARDFLVTIIVIAACDVWLTARSAAAPRTLSRLFHRYRFFFGGPNSVGARLWCGRNAEGEVVRRVELLCGHGDAPPFTSASRIAGLGGTRYYALAKEVLLRLPDEWDLYRTFELELTPNPPSRKDGYASCYTPEEDDETSHHVLGGREEQFWIVTLYEPSIRSLSDAAVKWVVAHELGHVVAGLPCGSLTVGGKPYTKVKSAPGEEFYREITREEGDINEKIADLIGRAWGFWDEEETWFNETSL